MRARIPRQVLSDSSTTTDHEQAPDLERLFAMVSDLVVATDRSGRIMLVNPAWEEILGWREDELVGRRVFELVHPDDTTSTHALAERGGTVANYTNRYRHKDGSWRWVLWSGRRDGDIWYAVGKDVTERRKLERRALSDELTGLANRALLLDHLRGSLARMERAGGTLVGVLFLDLDGFKLVNDLHGHEAGDRILTEVGRRLRSVVRASDVVARFGGDEFVIVAEELSSDGEAMLLAERVIDAVAREFVVEGTRHTLSCSVGVLTTADSQADPDLILRDADAAMYRAKTRGSSRVELFHTGVTLDVSERSDLEGELREALLSDQLVVFYQPIVAIPDGTLAGCEALVRWLHPQHGLILPDEFVPLAEMSGLILPLGQRVLESACRQAGSWRREGRDVTVSVNVSRRQLIDSDFTGIVREALDAGGVPGQAMCLEVTETAAPARHTGIVDVLKELRELGIKIALDDFGSGYSTLTTLRELPIDLIKIDRSFTSGVAAPGDDRGIVAAVMALARELGVAVIAEGVETDEQIHALRAMDCPLAQGDFFAPAAPPEELFAGGFTREPKPGIGDPFVIREFMRQIGIPARIVP